MHIEEIMKIIPHRYPFLLVDKIVELHPGEKAVGVKNVTVNEPFFAGHFPGNPVMPGVLMIEAVAQVGAIALLSDERYKGKLAFLAGVDKFRFKKRIVPGDVLFITAELITVKGSIGKAKGSVSLNGRPVCAGEFLFALS